MGAPFRGLRLFIYGSLASGAFLGGLITASGVIAALNGLRDDVDINEGYTNLAVDFGAVAFFGVLAKIELDNGAKLNKVNFAMTNILVVPYKTGVDAADRASKPDGGGFSDSRPAYETQPYVAE